METKFLICSLEFSCNIAEKLYVLGNLFKNEPHIGIPLCQASGN